MTKKDEAIKWFTMLREKFIGTEYGEYLDIAIEALEQDPCEDAISRQAVLDCLKATNLKKFDFILEARGKIQSLPSVTLAEKVGRWINHREHCEINNLIPSGLGSYFWCSECDCGIDNKEWHRNYYKYCPNCGAKMEVEE